MGREIFTKRVILYIEDGTSLNRIGTILGSTYGSILSGNDFTKDIYDGQRVIKAAACGRVAEDDFSKYPEVVGVEIEGL